MEKAQEFEAQLWLQHQEEQEEKEEELEVPDLLSPRRIGGHLIRPPTPSTPALLSPFASSNSTTARYQRQKVGNAQRQLWAHKREQTDQKEEDEEDEQQIPNGYEDEEVENDLVNPSSSSSSALPSDLITTIELDSYSPSHPPFLLHLTHRDLRHVNLLRETARLRFVTQTQLFDSFVHFSQLSQSSFYSPKARRNSITSPTSLPPISPSTTLSFDDFHSALNDLLELNLLSPTEQDQCYLLFSRLFDVFDEHAQGEVDFAELTCALSILLGGDTVDKISNSLKLFSGVRDQESKRNESFDSFELTSTELFIWVRSLLLVLIALNDEISSEYTNLVVAQVATRHAFGFVKECMTTEKEGGKKEKGKTKGKWKEKKKRGEIAGEDDGDEDRIRISDFIRNSFSSTPASAIFALIEIAAEEHATEEKQRLSRRS